MSNVMIDAETLGVGNSPVLLSLGAAKFNGTEILDSFHVAIDPASCQAVGLKIDAGTVMWWMHNDRGAAREALAALAAVDIGSALMGFADWFGPEELPVWGNGATADNVWLRNAYELMHMPCPWSFWNDRCYRTMKNIAPHVPFVRSGTHHDALDDAITQAKHLQAIAADLEIAL